MTIEADNGTPEAGQDIPASAPTDTAPQDAPETAPERTFTQAELDDIVAKRIARERRKLEKVEREREIAEAVRADREQRQQKTSPSGPPQRDQFDSYEDYLEAKADWKVEEKLSEREAKLAKEREAEQAKAYTDRIETNWTERLESAREKYRDFDDVVLSNEELPVSPAMAEAIKASDVGVDVAYHLGKHPKEAARIAALDPVSQIFEMGKIAASISSKPVSKAPPPLETGRGGRSGSNDLYDPGLSFDEYKRRREAQLKRG
jgi:hypothetical protein